VRGGIVEDYKLTISRSYSRTKQIAQYEPASSFCALSLEVPVETSEDERLQMSEELFNFCKESVESDFPEGGISESKLLEMIRAVRTGGSIMKADFDQLNTDQQLIIKETVNLYKTSASYKNKVTNSSVENESNRKA
jgi:hypothetical protein